MNATRTLLIFGAAVLSIASSHAQVFKCPDASGKVTYSQAPCAAAGGQLLDSRRPSDAPPAELTQRREVERAMRSPQTASPQQQRTTAAPDRAQCMSELEVRNLAASGTSIKLDPMDREVHTEQLRRARSCETLMSEGEMFSMKERLRAQRRANRPPPPTMLTNCDQMGCWGSDGARYNAAAGGNFHRQDGAFCTRSGDMLMCR